MTQKIRVGERTRPTGSVLRRTSARYQFSIAVSAPGRDQASW